MAVNCLITFAKTWPREGMAVVNPTADRSFVDAGELFVSRVNAVWAVLSYVVTDLTDDAVVGAKPNSSRHPWQVSVPCSWDFNDPTCFVGANLRDEAALSTLVVVISSGCWLGVWTLGPRRGVSSLGRCLAGHTVRVCSGVRSMMGRLKADSFYGVTEEGVGCWWLCEVADRVP